MNIGIVTFQYAYNYGAVLQCLALQETLKSFGCTVSIIDFHPPTKREDRPWQGWGLTDGNLFRYAGPRWVKLRHAKPMMRTFDNFRSNFFNLTTRCESVAEVEGILNEFDVLVAGSDQIWNRPKSQVYLLNFRSKYEGRKVSYAATFGTKYHPSDDLAAAWNSIRDFDSISVRDDFSRELIQNFEGLTPAVVADPTLLIDLDNVRQRSSVPYVDYILMYTLGSEICGGHTEALRLIRSAIGNLPAVGIIPSAHKPRHSPSTDYNVWRAGPSEWMDLIARSAFVYTDSFHGLLFALKYGKPCIAYFTEEWRSHRLVDIAHRYGIDDLVVSSAEELGNSVSRDLSEQVICAQERISLHADQSKRFLKSAIFA